MIATRFTESFGCQYPIQQAGMGGFASPSLALAVAAAGGFGGLSGTTSSAALAGQLEQLPPNAPIGVNFLVPFLDRAALELASSRTPLVEFFWGEPDAALVDLARADGARVGWQVGSVDEACAAQDAGCDLVIVQGFEAGGHVRGTVRLLPLLDKVRDRVDLIIIAAGGIGTGRAVATALTAGADAVRVGTRFVAAKESEAHPFYIDALITAQADDTVVTTAFSEGWPDAPHRVLRSCVDAGRALGVAQSWLPSWPSKDEQGPVNARALYAGESVTAVHSRQSAAEIIEELMRGAADAHASNAR